MRSSFLHSGAVSPVYTFFNFTGKRMPLAEHEPRIAPKLMKALARNTSIATLQLRNCNLCQAQARELAESLKENKTLQVLNIESNNLNSEGVLYIVEALKENAESGLKEFRFS